MSFPLNPLLSSGTHTRIPAIVYCGDCLDTIDGKTAHGLARYSRLFDILGFISTCNRIPAACEDAAPVYGSIEAALASIPKSIHALVIGMAPSFDWCDELFYKDIKYAIEAGLNIINGLHVRLTSNAELAELAARHNVMLKDLRVPPPLADWRDYSDISTPLGAAVILVLGMDRAIGKRTTAVLLSDALNRRGVRTELVTTGQTGILQGIRYGFPVDCLPLEVAVGMIQHMIVRAAEDTRAEIVVVEGQSAVGHPASTTSIAMLRAAAPTGYVLQIAPGRKHRVDYPSLKIPPINNEVRLIRCHTAAKLVALTVNPEGFPAERCLSTKRTLAKDYGVPTFDPIADGVDQHLEVILRLLSS